MQLNDLKIAGKVNNITVDKCTKTGIVFKVSARTHACMHLLPCSVWERESTYELHCGHLV